MTPERHGGKVERAEPDSEHHCSPVLRPDVAPTGKAGGAGAVRPFRAARPALPCLLRIIAPQRRNLNPSISLRAVTNAWRKSSFWRSWRWSRFTALRESALDQVFDSLWLLRFEQYSPIPCRFPAFRAWLCWSFQHPVALEVAAVYSSALPRHQRIFSIQKILPQLPSSIQR